MALRVIGGRVGRRVLQVVRWQEAQQVPHAVQHVFVVLADERRDTRLGGVCHRAAEGFHRDVFAGHRFDHVGTGDEHVRGLANHEREVGDRGGVDGAAGAWTHDHADLRDHAARAHVPLEDVAVAGERSRALLDARATRVVDRDERRAGRHREVHHLRDLLCVHFPHRAAEDGEVLARDEDLRAVDGAVPGDDAVARRTLTLHAEIVRPVHRERVGLDERALVHQHVETLTRGELAPVVLLLRGVASAGGEGCLPALAELLDAIFDRLSRLVAAGRVPGRSLSVVTMRRSVAVLVRAGASGDGAAVSRSAGRPRGPSRSSCAMRIDTIAFVRPLRIRGVSCHAARVYVS